MATDAQIQANRNNASRSTGPRSEAGKSASAQNSLMHGGYATSNIAIPRGHFVEDPDEITSFIGGIIASLDPRDELEHQEATNIAVAYLRLRRITTLEAESIAGSSSTRETEADELLRAMGSPETPEMKRESSAFAVLNQIMNLCSRIESRSSTSLDRALARYRHLQDRDTPPAS